MKTKIFGFALAFSLLLNVGYAQEELLLEDSPSDASSGGDDLFGGDFFSDLDSFLEDSSSDGDVVVEEPPVVEDSVLPVFEEPPAPEENTLDTSAPAETFQSSAGGGSAMGLPSSAQVTLTVTNESLGGNATQVGARPGDVLRYEIALSSQVEDVVDYVPTIDVNSMLSGVDFTNTGFGVLTGGTLSYPAYSHQAPCTQSFTFFVQVKDDCGGLTSLSANSPEAGLVSVPLNCGLSETGPTQRWFLLAGVLMLVLALGFGLSSRAKTS